MNWFQKNFKAIIYCAFIVPILTVAIVSISHVTKWYGLSNPLSWAIYLSVGIEIAALSALAAISAKMGKKVYFPFIIVTIIQFIGNIFFAYQYIDIDSKSFKDWVDLVDPVVSYLGVDSGDFVGHKRFLALFAGGMLPIISLSFLHMLVKFEEEEKKKTVSVPTDNLEIDIDKLSIEAGKIEAKQQEEDIIKIDEEKLKKVEEILLKTEQEKFGEETIENPEKIKEEKQEEPKISIEINQKVDEVKTQLKDNILKGRISDKKIEEVLGVLDTIYQTQENNNQDSTMTVTKPIYSDENGVKTLVYKKRDE